MNIKTILLLIICFVVFASSAFTLSNVKFACECHKRNDFEREFEISSDVFVGKVIEVDETSKTDTLITFEVEKIWKGNIVERITTHSKRGKSCGYIFSQGERYLVYAYDDDGVQRTTSCSRTSEIKSATDDLKKLAGKKVLFVIVENAQRRNIPVPEASLKMFKTELIVQTDF